MTPADLDLLCRALHQAKCGNMDKRTEGAWTLKGLRQRVGPVEVGKATAELRKEGKV
jgi:hypothetical protein